MSKRRSLVFVGNLMHDALPAMNKFKTSDLNLAKLLVRNMEAISIALKPYNEIKSQLDVLRAENQEVFSEAKQKVNDNKKVEFNKIVKKHKDIFNKEDQLIEKLKQNYLTPIELTLEIIDQKYLNELSSEELYKFAFMLPLYIDSEMIDHTLSV